MAKRDYYEVLGARAEAQASKSSSPHIRRLAKECHPDRNAGDNDAEHPLQGGQRGLRGPEGPAEARCLRPVRPRRVRRRHGRGGRGFGPDFASSMSDIFDDLFGEFMGGRRGSAAAVLGRERGADLRYNLEITLVEAFDGKTAQIRVPTSVTCETCSGSGAKRRHQADHLHDVRRPRQSAGEPGLLHDRAHLPQLPGPRRDDRGPVRDLPRLGPRHQGAHAFGQHSGRRRGRHAHPPCGRRRGRSCAAARPAISTSSCRSSRTSSSSATAPTSSARCRSR